MTTIVAIHTPNDGVKIASDRQISNSGRKGIIQSKWTLLKGGIAIGVAGSLLVLNMIENKKDSIVSSVKSPYDVANAIFENMVDDGLISSMEEESGGPMICEFLLSGFGSLWEVGQDFSVTEIPVDALAAVGSGSEYALGADYANISYLSDAEERVRRAVKAAEYYDTGTSGIWTATHINKKITKVVAS